MHYIEASTSTGRHQKPATTGSKSGTETFDIEPEAHKRRSQRMRSTPTNAASHRRSAPTRFNSNAESRPNPSTDIETGTHKRRSPGMQRTTPTNAETHQRPALTKLSNNAETR